MNLQTYITGTIQSKAYRLLRERVYAVLNTHDMTPTYWGMLGIIMESRDGIRQIDVAQHLHVKAPLITMMSQELQQKGLIRSVPNQFDARAKLLTTTPAGKKFVKSVEIALSDMLDKLLQGLNEADMIAYHKVLTTIIANDKAMK